MQILVADDDTDVNGLYRATLESRGHEVTLCVDGRECLVHYGKGSFDVVILDYKMPIYNGIQVAKEILSKNPNQRIILASAYPEESMTNLKELNTVIPVLPKPFEPDVLVEAVEGKVKK